MVSLNSLRTQIENIEMTIQSTNSFTHFRETLVPKGTSDLVRLSLKGTAFFHHDFILSVIRELETKVRLASMGIESLTDMDRLVLSVLKDSSGWDDGNE